jgi:hypothetical protein
VHWVSDRASESTGRRPEWNFTVPADRTSISDDVWTGNDEKKCSDHKIPYAEFQLGQ